MLSTSTLLTDRSALITSSSYFYDPDTYALDKETITYNLPNQPSFTRIIDRRQDGLGRSEGFQLQTPALITDHSTLLTYSPTNARLATVSGGAFQAPSQSFSYGYTPNSNMVATVEGPAHQVTNYYEPSRNVLLTKSNTRNSDNAIISSVTYEVNSIGQRKKRTTTDATASSVITDWNYDTLGQVTSEDKPGTDTDRAFEYDTIGNRKKSADSLTLPPSDNYTSNAINQYEAVDSFSITSEGYDNDGNQIKAQIKSGASFQLASYTWDAQNRLIEVKDLNSNSLVKHHYDAYSRRIATTTGSTTTLYVYDAWNCIAEYQLHNSSFTLHNSLLWGLDLSGSMQGAGGVGGLLAFINHNSSFIISHYPLYDGNGNVTEYIDSSENVVANYEYDAFGNTTVATKPKANLFPYRFSTKPLDATSGLYYYGYRWYDSLTGRWPSRDPIEEEGGLNLYGCVSNGAINTIDVLGLDHYHHWLMRADKYQIQLKKICPTINVDDFTTPYPGGNSRGEPHYAVHYGLSMTYSLAYEALLNAANQVDPRYRCCFLLLSIEILRHTIHSSMKEIYEGTQYTISGYPGLHKYKSPHTSTDLKWIWTVAKACSCLPRHVKDKLRESHKKMKINVGIEKFLRPYEPPRVIRMHHRRTDIGQPTPEMYQRTFLWNVAGGALAVGAVSTGVVVAGVASGGVIAAPAAAGGALSGGGAVTTIAATGAVSAVVLPLAAEDSISPECKCGQDLTEPRDPRFGPR